MIRGSDGLDYEDLAARLLGEPAKTGRNNILSSTHSAAFKAAFRETFDRHEAQSCSALECHRAAFAQACIVAGITNKFGGRNDFGVLNTHPHA